MTDVASTVAEVAESGASSFLDANVFWFLLAALTIGIGIGWYGDNVWRGYLDDAAEKVVIAVTAKKEKVEDKISTKYEAAKTTLDAKQKTNTEKANVTKDINCDTHALPPDRLQLFRQPRSLPAS